ncbi:MAG: response regulator transcription factor [Chitinophagaceae bacterium]|nr:response regulator transcription factor [Chitinophagaceae bacterium]MCW5927804.1 response regulator transcription factor [Chitinophagaceae bacterium]
MKILIVEDEDLAVKKLQKTLLAIDEEVEITGITDSIRDTVDWLQENPAPDLILMDIELADGQSFNIFTLTEVKCPVIFTTSYDEYALKAFKVNSIDYLLKPVQTEDLQAAFRKFHTLQKEKSDNNISNLVNELRQKLVPREYRKRFLVKNGQRLISIEVGDIAYFFSDGRLNFFKTTDNKKFVVDYTMDELEEMLHPDHFFRISRSFFITVPAIVKIDDYFGNRLILQLKPEIDKEVLVSREKVTLFKKWMGK